MATLRFAFAAKIETCALETLVAVPFVSVPVVASAPNSGFAAVPISTSLEFCSVTDGVWSFSGTTQSYYGVSSVVRTVAVDAAVIASMLPV